MTEFFQSLSKDFSQLLENSDDFNVIIRAGDEHNEKTFYAHSVVLRTRSPYFHTALSSDWARKEGNSIVFIKPNTTPIVFDLILKYVYSGRIDLSGQDNMDILDLLITADELLLEELFDHVQHYLLDLKTEWVKKNVVHVHRAIHSNENCNRLKNFCLEIICKNPLILFKSKEFYSFDETLLIPLLERDNLQIEEIEIWNYLIKWGVSQMSSSAVANLSSLKSDDDDNNGKTGTMDMEDKEEMVMVEKDGEEEKKGGNEQQEIIMDDKQIDISNWDKKEFIELERLLHNCIPLIRFFQITANDFHDNILQFSQILPKNLFDDILKFHLKRSCLPNLSVSSISKLIPNTKILPPRSLQFDSTLLKAEQVARLADWIDRKDGKGYTYNEIPYKFKLLVRGSLDGFDSEVFHEKCDHKGPTVVVMQIAYSGELVGGYNPLEWSIGDSRLTTQNSFLFSFPKQGNLTDGKVSRVTRFNYAIRIKDKSHGPCFGDKDLWMKNNFNGYDSCSSDKDDYLDRVTTLSKFWVIEYEVFQVIKK